jgi:hypothetical protein
LNLTSIAKHNRNSLREHVHKILGYDRCSSQVIYLNFENIIYELTSEQVYRKRAADTPTTTTSKQHRERPGPDPPFTKGEEIGSKFYFQPYDYQLLIQSKPAPSPQIMDLEPLLPTALFSPSKAAAQRAQAQDWHTIDVWLSSKYQGRSVPIFERNEETLATLLALVKVNEKADEERELIVGVWREGLAELSGKGREGSENVSNIFVFCWSQLCGMWNEEEVDRG